MRKYYSIALLVAALALQLCPARAGEAPAFMAVGARTSQPIGHYEFCRSYRDECAEHASSGPVKLTPQRWSELQAINNAVNAAIEPVTDQELYGLADFWTYAVDKGDCEDYVLVKRLHLINAGWPMSSLLITVVRQTNGDGHAVLTIRTDRGDLILDNLDSRILVWNQTPYQYIKRQAATDSGAWQAISDDRSVLVGSLKR